MNIGIVTTWFERGGAYVSRQYRDLLKNDFNVFIYARGGEYCAIGDPNWDDITVTWAKRILLPTTCAIDRSDFTRWIVKNNIETVLFNEQQWWLPILWCKELGIKTSAYVDYYTEETIPLFACFDALFCNTKRHFETFAWHPGARYVPWGTDINLFRPISYFPVTKGAVSFFHSAGMSPSRKGSDFVIRAFAETKGNAKMIIHSQVNLQRLFLKLQPIINRLVQEGKLTIIESTVPAPGCYHLGDVYVYPSRLDGIGLTIAEALSCGLPVIVPDNPPMNEFVGETNGQKVAIGKLYSRADGYYWPQCEIDLLSLVQKMQWYIDRQDQMALFKKQAREYAEEKLDWRQNGKTIIEIFEEMRPIVQYDANDIIAFENRRAKNSWLLRLYMEWPVVFSLLNFLVSLRLFRYLQKVTALKNTSGEIVGDKRDAL